MLIDTTEFTKAQFERYTKDRMRPSFLMYMNNVGEVPNDMRCAEIGTSTGLNAEVMLKEYPISLVVVDPYITNPEEEQVMRDRLDKYKDRVEIVIGKSVDAARKFPDNYFDYVYIDGDHEYDSVVEDLEAWYPKVNTYGILAGHDFVIYSVQKAVLEFGDRIDRAVFGVNQYISPLRPRSWNLEQGCDWWIWVDKPEKEG